MNDGKRKTCSSRRISVECPSHLPVSKNRNGTHTVTTAIFRGNTELLLWADLFSGYVFSKATSSRTANTIAEFTRMVCFEDLGPVKRSATVESQNLCLISFELLIGLRGRNNVQTWRTELRRTGQQMKWCKH